MSNRSALLGEYGVIGDPHTVGLVSMDASLDCLCLSSSDSPSVFAALLEAERGGRFQIAPVFARATHKQLYLPETNASSHARSTRTASPRSPTSCLLSRGAQLPMADL